MQIGRLATPLAGLLIPVCAMASPMDGVLHGGNPVPYKGLFLELGVDAVNDRLDVLDIRGQHDEFAGTDTGDYRGFHFVTAFRPSKLLEANFGLWQRTFLFGQDEANVDSWQGSLSLLAERGDGGLLPRTTVGYSIWGNNLGQLNKSSRTTLFNQTVDGVSVTGVEDLTQQVMLDLDWTIGREQGLNLNLAYGKGEVNFDELFIVRDGCRYQVESPSPTELYLTLVEQTGTCTVQSAAISDPSAPFPGESLYISNDYHYWQAILSYRWNPEPFLFSASIKHIGYQTDLHDDVDALGRSAVTYNNLLYGEAGYRINRNVIISLRGTVMQKQFLGEIPALYNPFTAHRFNERYGYLSLNLRAGI